MRRIILLHLLFLALPASLSGLQDEQAATLFESANQSYAEGNFEQARDIYLHLIENRGPSVHILKNLGNCHFRLEDLPRAILVYEKALFLRPNHPDLINNIRVCREILGIDQDPIPLYRPFTRILNTNEWAWLGWFSLLVTGTLLFPVRVLRSSVALFSVAWKSRFVRALPACMGSFSLIAFAASCVESAPIHHAIAIASPVTVRVSPFTNAVERSSVVAGTKIRFREKHGDYVSIQLPDQTIGWVALTDIELVHPPL